jgi:cytochrome c biogenesis protein CcmG/thiol:disulfide interchange protein DsbE
MRRSTFVIVVVGLGLLLVGAAVTRHLTGSWLPTAGPRTGPPPALTSGRGVKLTFTDHPQPAPEIALADLDGRPVNVADWKGKVVLVNFWATWCGPCVEEIPALEALQEHYRDQLVILGLSIDTKPAAEVKQFAARLKVNYPVAMSTEAIERALGGVSAVPVTFLIDPEGRVVQRHVGLINPTVTEHEIRTLAKLPTEATVSYAKDTGQLLLGNAAYATEIPGLDLSKLTSAQRETALKQLNADHCTCGCGLTLAQCRINDPDCTVSLPLAQDVVKKIAK